MEFLSNVNTDNCNNYLWNMFGWLSHSHIGHCCRFSAFENASFTCLHYNLQHAWHDIIIQITQVSIMILALNILISLYLCCIVVNQLYANPNISSALSKQHWDLEICTRIALINRADHLPWYYNKEVLVSTTFSCRNCNFVAIAESIKTNRKLKEKL